MAEERTITQEQFNVLLDWLGPDKESAANRYEVIRRRLIRVFGSRGCDEAETLADVTIDRVTLKAPELNGNYVGDPALYFYGVANNVFHEWCRRRKRTRETVIPDLRKDDLDDREAEYRCLEKCLSRLAVQVREMMVEYYRDDKRARIERRREMAARLGITPGALQIKTSRVRARLGECVRECLARG
jgi:DNA-directed RNA polymerase specialized sigma24 family protein